MIDRVSQTSRIYVDGLVRDETAEYTLPTTNPRAVIFGAEAEEGFLVDNTVIDDVRIWSYPISDQAVADLYTDFNPGVSLCLNRPEMDSTGPDGFPDCKVDLYEFAEIASAWLECGRLPVSYCN